MRKSKNIIVFTDRGVNVGDLPAEDRVRRGRGLPALADAEQGPVRIEHDREVVKAADQLLDFGPAAGDSGGLAISGPVVTPAALEAPTLASRTDFVATSWTAAPRRFASWSTGRSCWIRSARFWPSMSCIA